MNKNPLWISHRGFTKNAVENTRAAFQAAVDLRFSCLETDLRLTRDGCLVLIHDPDLRRLAGDPRRVQDVTASELAEIRLTSPDKRGPGLQPPDFSDKNVDDAHSVMFFDAFAREFSQCRWVLDIKPEAGEETLLALARWAKDEALVRKIVQEAKMLTWDQSHEALAGKLFPGVQLYAREGECWRAGLAVMCGLPAFAGIQAGKTYALPPSVFGLPLFRPAIVRRFQKRGALVVAFLPPGGSLTRQAVAVGVDEILTNYEIEPEGQTEGPCSHP